MIKLFYFLFSNLQQVELNTSELVENLFSILSPSNHLHFILIVIKKHYPYNKVTGCLSLCVYRRISLTTEPIWFSFTVLLLIGPGKVYSYFGGRYHHPSKRNRKTKHKR